MAADKKKRCDVFILLKLCITVLESKRSMKHFMDARHSGPSSPRDSIVIKRKYGDLKTSLMAYVTPWMLGLILLITTVVALNFEVVKHNFTSGHVALNGTIVAVFVIGVIQACYQNIRLWHVSRFLGDVDHYMDIGKISHADYLKLQHRLERSASLINVKTTFSLLDNLYQFGNMMIRDKDAILIKSKLGYRVRSARNGVSFLTGILVMFGLIGTFWGLLETIASVATALNDIAASSSSETSASDMDMGGILGAISGPLKGMGLAFSASLFGLSGSLLLGFFTHLSGDAQNKVIEDISRWIDDRIPTPDQATAEKGRELKGEGVKENSNLEAWLATYAFLARRTEQGLTNLFENFSALIGQFEGLSRNIANLDEVQRKTNDLLVTGNQERNILTKQYEKIIENLSPLPNVIAGVDGTLAETRDSIGKMLSHSECASRDMASYISDISRGIDHISASSDSATKAQAVQLESSKAIIHSMDKQQSVLQGFHAGLLAEIKEMNKGWAGDREHSHRSQQALQQNIEEQIKLNRSAVQNAEHMASVLERLQHLLDGTMQSLNNMSGVLDASQSGMVERAERAIGSMIEHIASLRNDLQHLKHSKGYEETPVRKKSIFGISRKK